jgi:dihydrofolate reductase
MKILNEHPSGHLDFLKRAANPSFNPKLKKSRNMPNLISFMHISLDGFVAGPNGEMDWIKINEEIFDHVEARIRKTDTALYGRVTYQMMENYWPTAADKPDASRHDINHSGWYRKSHKVVLSKTMAGINLPNTTIISQNLPEKVAEIKRQANSEILVFGSPSATHALIQHNLIDGYWLFVNPVILGQGIPLFKNIKNKVNLNLVTTRTFACGVNELSYFVNRN